MQVEVVFVARVQDEQQAQEKDDSNWSRVAHVEDMLGHRKLEGLFARSIPHWYLAPAWVSGSSCLSGHQPHRASQTLYNKDTGPAVQYRLMCNRLLV